MKHYPWNHCRREWVLSRVSQWLRGGVSMVFIIGACTAGYLSVGSQSGYSQPTEPVAPVTSLSLLQQGDEAFRRGAFEQAAQAWQQSAQTAHKAGNLREECDASPHP